MQMQMKFISNNSESPSEEAVRAAPGAAGASVTSQRTLILRIIQEGEGHLNADEIYRRARQEYPRLSMSTVYRPLQVLKRLGLIEEVHIDETLHHYEAKQATEHHHLVCQGCGRVIEFHYPLARQIKKAVPDAKDFDIISTELRVTGYCPKCRRKRK